MNHVLTGVVATAAVEVVIAVAGQVVRTDEGPFEAHAQTALADAATAPYEAAGQAVATQGITPAEMDA